MSEQSAEKDLYGAVSRGSVPDVVRALNAGANVNARTGSGGISALLCAVINGREAIVQILTEHHADVNAKSDIGETPLMRAAAYHSLSMAKFLVEHGARLDDKNENNLTAIMYAANAGKPAEEIVHFLAEQGAAMDVVNRRGETVVESVQKRIEDGSVLHGGTLAILEAAIEKRRLAAKKMEAEQRVREIRAAKMAELKRKSRRFNLRPG